MMRIRLLLFLEKQEPFLITEMISFIYNMLLKFSFLYNFCSPDRNFLVPILRGGGDRKTNMKTKEDGIVHFDSK